MRVIKLNKTDDIAQVIQYIKDLKDREVVFELEKGSPLLASSTNMKLMKKTGEVLGKKIRVHTDDPTGRMLALKAEVLDGESSGGAFVPANMPKVKRSDVKPRFSDIRRKPGSVSSIAPKSGVPVASRSARASDIATPPPSQYIKSAQDKFISSHPNSSPVKTKRRSNFSKIFIVSMVVLVIVVFALSVLLPTADITIYARSEPITRDVEVTIDKSASKVDAATMVIGAQAVSRDVSQTKNFPATGSKNIGTKATGSVVLYNFTKSTLTLKASTSVLLVNGKRFLFTKDATGIRPTSQIGSGTDQEVDPSSLTPPIGIVAESAGEDSNIAANSKFSIINAALGNQNVYAMNSAALTGGTSKTIKVVSQTDLDTAAASMTNSIAEQAEADLNAENSTNDVKILPSGITKEVLAKTANKNVNDQADNFDMTMIAKISGLSYKESDVKNLVKQKITSVLSEDKYLLPDAQETVSANFKSLDLAKGSGVLSVHYETRAAYKVSATDMSKLLAGKTANEIKEILLAKPEIDRVDVQFSPFFVNKAPKLNGKIYIHSMLSEG